MNSNLVYRNNIDNSKNLFDITKCVELINQKDKLKFIDEGVNGIY